MDKITRVLILYKRLIEGKIINKAAQSIEFSVSERSLDRDIQDIRLFLHESRSYEMELIYDERQKGYRIEGPHTKREITVGECYILTKLLLDSRPLRTDDQEEIVQIMLSQLTDKSRRQVDPVLRHTPKIPACLEKASVKLVEDLLKSIEKQDEILLHFGAGYVNIACIPYSIEFRSRKAYLVGWRAEQGAPALFLLDDILSYVTKDAACQLNEAERHTLQELVALVCSGTPETYQALIYKREEQI